MTLDILIPFNIYIGVDPGVVNTGVSISATYGDTAFKVFKSFVFSPRAHGKELLDKAVAAEKLAEEIGTSLKECLSLIPDKDRNLLVYKTNKEALIERYVAYQGKLTPESEEVLLFIGSLISELRKLGISVKVARAVDWKMYLVKQLFKKEGFKNPSEKLDKKFSDAAATHIIGVKPKTNHESDAICMSYVLHLKQPGKEV